MEKIKCNKCGIEKPVSEFPLKYMKDGKRKYRCTCKDCKKKNKVSLEEYKLTIGTLTIEEKKNIVKNYALKHKYGITLKQYEEMYSDQQGLCKICGTYHNTLCVDHCHDSGEVRGLLCNGCNKALGLFKDNSTILGRAILYLKQTRTDKN